jgi:hypothetical protein
MRTSLFALEKGRFCIMTDIRVGQVWQPVGTDDQILALHLQMRRRVIKVFAERIEYESFSAAEVTQKSSLLWECSRERFLADSELEKDAE